MKVTNILGLAAVGAVLVLAAPTERAYAVSLASPPPQPRYRRMPGRRTTEVRWGRGGHHRRWGWHRRTWRR